MAETFRSIRYLDIQELLELNRSLVTIFGGLISRAGIVHNENSLLHLIETVQSSYSGVDRYPSIWEKASLYAFNIITGIFFMMGIKGLEWQVHFSF